ncbi:SPX domain-containing protein [Dionaea muscipula]
MRLVRECEANLDLLFPLEEEVTESTSDHPHDQSNVPPPPQPLPPPPLNDVESILHETSSLGEGTDIYRSTLSAMRTIQGLRMSSTCNPLSFSALFRSKDEEAAGAVTSEDLASVSALRNENADQEDDATSTAPSP